MSFTYIRRAAVALALIATVGCTVHDTPPPPLTGPSGLALSLTVNAIPDSISQDGGSQSSVKVTAIGPDGRSLAALPLRLDMFVNGVAQDYGTLSARSVVTNNDGVATAVYTAPPSPVNGVFGTCSGLPGNCVSIVATATATNFATANPEQVQIRLVPTGVILPPAGLPVASFAASPTPAQMNVPVTFDGSTSKPGTGATQITSYAWSFGDGTTATGRTVNHTFSSLQTFNVTLTVTNDRGLSASTTNALSVGAVAGPTLKVVFSPTAPQAGQTIVFNADQSTAAPGHTLDSFSWNFGDGTTATGSIVSHAFSAAGTYNVVLNALDDTGQKASTSVPVSVAGSGGGSGGATAASFVASPSAPVVGQVVFFNASGSSATTGHTLTKYAWDFGDGTLFTATSASTNHTFTTVGAFTVTLVVTDDTGQTAKATNTVTVAAAGAVAPTANFTFSPAAPGVNEAVFFNAGTSLPGVGHTIVSYAWTFGDGGTASGVTATHAYSTAGTYAVQLKVTDEAGQATTSAATSITVGSPPAPTSRFTFSPTTPPVGQQVVFDASTSSTAQGQTIVDVAWNFGDGTPVVHCPGDPSCTSTNRISAHTYTFVATFVVNLVVTDSAGRTGSSSQNIGVVSPNPTPVLFLAKTGGNAIQADGSGSTATGAASIVTYRFIWGDGTPDTVGAASSVPHTFGAAGLHTVTLVVTDSLGRGASTSKDITTP